MELFKNTLICQSILVLMLCLMVVNNLVFAATKKCTLNGEWFDTNASVSVFKLKQEGSKVTMDGEISHPVCGAIIADGIVEQNHFDFKVYMANNDLPYCKAWTQITGTIDSVDCAKMDGEMTMHWMLNDLPEETIQPLHWLRNMIKITNPLPENTLVITAEPKMPEFKAFAVLQRPDSIEHISRTGMINYSAPLFAWNVRILHSPIPGKLDFDVALDEAVTNEAMFNPDFSLLKNTKNGGLIDGGVMGGELTLSVEYYKAVRDEKKYIIKGTNPGKAAIEQILTDPVTRYIACQESKYQQFLANREGGVGFPIIGRDENYQPTGGIGIMQIFNPSPTAAQTWNWIKNLEAGISLLAEKRSAALTLPKTERGRLNKERSKMNLPFCGNLPPLSEEQVQRETLRRYNGGREYRWEPRDDPNCKGGWVAQPTMVDGSDPDYVEKVMSCKL